MITLQAVSKVFNNKQVLKDINLNIRKGEIFGLIGLSGAGKSTLIRLINGLESASEGQIITTDKLKFGFVFQDFNLVNSLTVFENVELALINDNLSKPQLLQKVARVLKLVGLEDYANYKPSQLSGGQKQRVGIARGLVSGVDVLLCDEATSALDAFTAREIINLLSNLNKDLGLTIIFVSHQLEIVRDFCDRIAIVDHGEICEVGDTIEIFSNPKSQISIKLLANVLGFDVFLNQADVRLITCYSHKQINECIKQVVRDDTELLATYQHQTKQGVFAHLFIKGLTNTCGFKVRRINEL